ncbi:NYN domain-containing protein [Gemmobacter serpentinus]|uniref:NYN domain-containing protein n=1 Tax=Gemmobacter serpentinus TaxID=2652247 RepID=UPI00124C3E14|nr:hypothetical protein [Gemmobacter serpentinus]
MIDLALHLVVLFAGVGLIWLLLDTLRQALRRAFHRRAPRQPRPATERRTPRRLRPKAQVPVLIDGSNVVMWQQNAGLAQEARIDTLIEVLDQIAQEGRPAKVIFDATIGYRLQGRYLNERDLDRIINRPTVTLQVVNSGETADAALLAEAARTGAPIVTNDRFRDHPRPHGLRLRGGGYSKGRIRLRA